MNFSRLRNKNWGAGGRDSVGLAESPFWASVQNREKNSRNIGFGNPPPPKKIGKNSRKLADSWVAANFLLFFPLFFRGGPNPNFRLFFLYGPRPKMGSAPGQQNRKKGGGERIARFGGAGRTKECPLQNQFWMPQNPKDPAVLKILCVVNLLRVVFLLSPCDLLSRCTLCGHQFPGNYRHRPSPGRVRGVVNLGGVVKTLRRSNSLFLLSS